MGISFVDLLDQLIEKAVYVGSNSTDDIEMTNYQ